MFGVYVDRGWACQAWGQLCEDISKHQAGPSRLPDLCFLLESKRYSWRVRTCLETWRSPQCGLCLKLWGRCSLAPLPQPVPHLRGPEPQLRFLSCLFNCSAVMGPALTPLLALIYCSRPRSPQQKTQVLIVKCFVKATASLTVSKFSPVTVLPYILG